MKNGMLFSRTMIDIRYIESHPDEVKKNAAQRRMSVDIDALLECSNRRRELITTIENRRSNINRLSATFQQVTEAERTSLKQEVTLLKESIASDEGKLREVEDQLESLMLQVPNLASKDSPLGFEEQENIEIYRCGEPTNFSFVPKDHVELGKDLDILDFETGTKVVGPKFFYFKNMGALLELALCRFAIDHAIAEKFTFVITPDLARDSIIQGSGFTPRGPETQIYSIENSDLSLIGTAEITLGGIHAGDTLSHDILPIKYAGLSHCFRTEAGSGGKESHGLYRVHQFTKVELYVYCDPSDSDKQLEQILSLEKKIYKDLSIPFRVVNCCRGELGAPAYRKYDIEAWMPSKNDRRGGWGEITSVSNCTDFQARRLDIKIVGPGKSRSFAHTLNGTAIAVSRVWQAIIENCQQKDGSILIPEALVPYTGFRRITKIP
jgi:seryl-tRNA synthetase